MKVNIDYVYNNIDRTKFARFDNSDLVFYYINRDDKDFVDNYEGIKKYGLYILLSSPDSHGKRTIYIGQSKDISNRLKQHSVKKDFWSNAFVCVSNDNHFTRDIITYLECMCIRAAVESGNCPLMNNYQIPDKPNISAELEEYCNHCFTMIKAGCNVLGLNNIFSEYTVVKLDEDSSRLLKRVTNAYSQDTDYADDDMAATYTYNDLTRETFVKGYMMSNEKFIVFAGSKVNGDVFVSDKIYECIDDATKEIIGGTDNNKWKITYE